jgi:hypothetical protein
MIGQAWRPVLGAREQTQDALADVVEAALRWLF